MANISLCELVTYAKENLQGFLDVMASHYRYTLPQLLMLYSQEFTAEEELAGWEYVQKKSADGDKRYVCMVGETPVFLFPVKDLSLRKRRGVNRINASEEFLKYTGLSISSQEGMKGFVFTDSGEVSLDPSVPDIFIRAAIAHAAPDKKSIFCKDVIEYLFFKENYPEHIGRLGWKELYQLFVESYTWYQELVYLFKGKYFTINEIMDLNLCWDSENMAEFEARLKKIKDGNVFLKFQDLTLKEKNLLFLVVRGKRLTHYPVFGL